MDVDRLRPGTVPLAPETVLWFEFLLDPTLLMKHLSKPNPDPSPTDLIIKFLGVDRKEETIVLDEESSENEIRPCNKITKRSLAIRLLTMKVMAFLNWDLDVLEAKLLPLPMQVTLLHDLLYIAMEEEVNIHSHSSMDLAAIDHQTLFAVSLYHRWVLKSYMGGALVTKQPRVPFIPMPGVQDPNLIAANQREEIRSQLNNQIVDSFNIINNLVSKVNTITVPCVNSFIHISEDTTEIKTKWSSGIEISPEELKCQIHYELGCFSFFKEDYTNAKKSFSECQKLFEKLEANPQMKNEITFCTVDKEKLEGYCKALGIDKKSGFTQPSDLFEQYKISVQNQYTGIMQILQADNIAQVIPLIERDLLEVDVQVAMCSGGFTVAKDLLFKIQILNALRKACTNEIMNVDFLQILGNAGDKGFDFFLLCLKTMVNELKDKKLENLKYFLFDMALKELTMCDQSSTILTPVLLENPAINILFSEDEISSIKLKMWSSSNEINEILSSSTSDVSLHLISKCPRLEVMNIQQQLIQSYSTETIKKLLQKLCSKDPTRSWWKLNNKWDLPIPLQSVVMTLPKGFLQDLVYILLAKSRELSNNKDFRKSILLLENTAKEVRESKGISSNTMYKLNRLLDWEILLVQINQYLEEYPENNIYPAQLISSCKGCLAAVQAGDSVIPRLEIMENCALALLNLGEWEILTSMDKRWTYLELAAAIAYACQDINKHKGSKKISRDAWDLVLPVFGPAPSSKRNAGATASPTGSNLTKNSLVSFLVRLREPTCLAVVISLLARLHNVLKDEPNLEICCQYIGLWPAVVSNSNSYSSRSVAEVLAMVTLQALKFMPKHNPFLKILGDLNYVSNDWANALKYYLEAGATASDFFSQPIPKTVLDDFAYKRMIKCCSQLQCHTQAAVLCQFLDEVDYTCAFKNLSETKNSHCADAMDAYYCCIWDATILEYLINMHNKRGEMQRKQQVIKQIGLLELNSNNNEEIQREAANIRKKQFLRAMINQYSISSNINSFFINN